jgi:predicted MFS family arabinose efflux permease
VTGTDSGHVEAQRPGSADRRSAIPDATSTAAFLTLCTYTWFLYGVGPSLPLFRDELGTSSAVAGLHSLMLAAGVVIAGFAGVNLTRRWRRSGAAMRGIVLMSSAVLLFTGGSMLTGAELFITLPAMLLIGAGGGLALNISTTVLQEHNGAFGPAMLSLGNAAAAGVGLVTPLAVGAATALGWTWRAAMVLVVPLAVVALLLIHRQRKIPAYAAVPIGTARFTFRGLPQAYWLAAFAVVCAVAIEFCMITWTPDLLADRTGMSPGAASGAVSAVVGGMAIGRLVIGTLATHRSPLGLFLAGVAVTGAGWVLVWTVTSPIAAVAGLFVVGLGVAGQYPLGAAMVMALSGGQPDRAIAVMGIGVGISSGLGPFALGALADELGVRSAFLVVPALCVAAAISITVGQRWGRRLRTAN